MSSWQPAIENEAVFDKAARKRMKRSKRIIENPRRSNDGRRSNDEEKKLGTDFKNTALKILL